MTDRVILSEPDPRIKTLDAENYVMVCDVSAPVSGQFIDWPANIQDGLHAAIHEYERQLSAHYGVKRCLDPYAAECTQDPVTRRWSIAFHLQLSPVQLRVN